MCTDVSSIAKLAEAVSIAKHRSRMALIPDFLFEVDTATLLLLYSPVSLETKSHHLYSVEVVILYAIIMSLSAPKP
jgi:hypothetical protein